MTPMLTEVYEAFRSINIPEDKATAAAQVIAGKENVTTKEDLLNLENRLNERILNLEKRILLQMGGMFIVAIGLLATLMKVL